MIKVGILQMRSSLILNQMPKYNDQHQEIEFILSDKISTGKCTVHFNL